MSLLQDLFEIKQAGANTQFEEMTKTFETGMDTLLKHQLNSKMLDYDIANKKITQDRDEKRDALSTFQTISQSFDNPLDKYDWLATDKARNLAIKGDAHTEESYHNFLMGESEKANSYEDIQSKLNAFRTAESKDWKSVVTDYDFADLQDFEARAQLTGDSGLISAAKSYQDTWKFNTKKKYGMDNVGAMLTFLKEKKYITDENMISSFEERIAEGNYAIPEKQMLNIVATKLQQDSDVMQLYRMEEGSLEEQYKQNIIDEDEWRQGMNSLRGKYEPRFKVIREMGFQRDDDDDTPVVVSTIGMPSNYQAPGAYSFGQQLDQGDEIALSQSFRGLPANMDDVKAITLSPGSKIYADIGQGMAMYDADTLRRMAIQKPGNIKFSNNEEQKKKAYTPFVINQKTDRGVVSPRVQVPLWSRKAVSSGTLESFNEKNIIYKDLGGDAEVVDIKSGKRGKISGFAVGEPQLIAKPIDPTRQSSLAGFGVNIGTIGSEKVYSSKDSKITVQLTYEEGDKIPSGSNVGDIYFKTLSMDEFIKTFAAPNYRLPPMTNASDVNNPYAGLDNSILNLGK